MSTFEKVRDILCKQLNIGAGEVTPESEIIKDLGADSLDVVEMLMTFEEEFNITVSEEDAVKLETVQNIVDLIEKK